MIACENTGRRARLIELDPKYVDVIVTRWQNLTGANAILSGNDRRFADLETERLGNTAAQSQKGAS
jgi:DNA modification methylase